MIKRSPQKNKEKHKQQEEINLDDIHQVMRVIGTEGVWKLTIFLAQSVEGDADLDGRQLKVTMKATYLLSILSFSFRETPLFKRDLDVA